jgi:hypothetical protein
MVELSDQEFRDWLDGKAIGSPMARQWALAIAARGAARVAIMIIHPTAERVDQPLTIEERSGFLSALRAINVSLVSGTMPLNQRLRDAARDASRSRLLAVSLRSKPPTPGRNAAANVAEVASAKTIEAAIAAASKTIGWAGAALGATAYGPFSDYSYLKTNTADELLHIPLWPENGSGVEMGPETVRLQSSGGYEFTWQDLRSLLLADAGHWQIWIDWYERLLIGRPSNVGFWGVAGDIGKQLDVDIATLHEKEWNSGPEYVNARIAQMVEKGKRDEARQEEQIPLWGETQSPPGPYGDYFALDPATHGYQSLLPDSELSGVEVPSQSAAAIEPVWHGDVLTLPQRLAVADLTESDLQSALQSLRRSLSQMADDAALESNIDQRIVRALRRVAEIIPDAPPTQDIVFTLGHVQERLEDYLPIVNAEWPNVLGTDYCSAITQFERTVRQFPRWREFVRNSDRETLQPEDVTLAQEVASTVVDLLGDDQVSPFVGPEIRAAFQKLLNLLPSDEVIDQSNREMERMSEELALDLFESVNNLLKRMGEMFQSAGSALWKNETLRQTITNFAQEFKKELPKVGGRLGKKAAANGIHFAAAVVIFIGASALGLSTVATIGASASPFLAKFKWLKALLKQFSL